MKTINKYLVVRATGECRITTRRPLLRLDEVAYALRVDVPDGWGRVIGNLSVEMPPPDFDVTVES